MNPLKCLPAALLVVAVISGSDASAQTASTAGIDACAPDPESKCNAEFERSSRQCDRYYLRETEAYSLCHDSAEQRKALCIERAGKSCAEGNQAPADPK